MKSTFLFLVIILSCSSITNAQELLSGQSSGNARGLISTTPVVLNERVEGTPYVTEKFVPAKISASENNIFYVRYNAVNDEIEVKGEHNTAYALNKYRRDITIEFLASKKVYQNFTYINSDDNQVFGYFVLLNDSGSNIKFLKKELIKFFDEKIQVTGYDTPQPAKYKRLGDKYFIKIGNHNAVIIPTNKKEFAGLFPQYEKEVLSFIKKERLKLKKEEDLTKLINFLNQLS